MLIGIEAKQRWYDCEVLGPRKKHCVKAAIFPGTHPANCAVGVPGRHTISEQPVCTFIDVLTPSSRSSNARHSASASVDRALDVEAPEPSACMHASEQRPAAARLHLPPQRGRQVVRPPLVSIGQHAVRIGDQLEQFVSRLALPWPARLVRVILERQLPARGGICAFDGSSPAYSCLFRHAEKGL